MQHVRRTRALTFRLWGGKDRAWLERTAEANTLLVEEILLLIGNDTEDYFLLKKQPRRPAGKEKP